MNTAPKPEETPFLRLFQKAKIEFMFNHPFLSVLSLSLPIVESHQQENLFETNGYRIYLNQKKGEGLSGDEVLHLYAHVLLHVILRHATRRKDRDPDRWNRAGDLAVESLLDSMDGKWKRPAGAPSPPEAFRDLSAEEIYQLLPESLSEDGDESDSSDGDLHFTQASTESDEMSPEEIQEKLDVLLLQAKAAASKSEDLPGFLLKEIDRIIVPEVSLEDALRDYLVVSLFERTADFRRPSRKYIHRNLYLPGTTHLTDRLSATIAVDSSASVSFELYKKFLGVVARTCQEFHEFSIRVIPFDDTVRTDLSFTLDQFDSLESSVFQIPKSDGGTNLAPLLAFLEESTEPVDVLLVITDGRFEMVRNSPAETVFLLTEDKNISHFERYGRVIRARI